MNKTVNFFCGECNEKREFWTEGNIKFCTDCGTKSSYRYVPRKRWTVFKSNPDLTGESPYNQLCDENTKDKFDEVASKFTKLSKRERDVIELLWEGKTQHQVGTILGISQKNVSIYLNRARKKLI